MRPLPVDRKPLAEAGGPWGVFTRIANRETRMNRDDLVHVLAVSRGLPKPAARDVVDIVLGCVEEALIEGGRVELRGFGRFRRVRQRATGHHPDRRPHRFPSAGSWSSRDARSRLMSLARVR